MYFKTFVALFCANFILVLAAPNYYETKIIGGEDADIANFPYQVAIRVVDDSGNSRHICGGSIINEITILTAAHCVNTNNSFIVHAGSTISDTAAGGQASDITEIYIHPRFDFFIFDFDVAVVKIFPPLQYNYAVQPIELPAPHSDVPGGALVNLTGWGLTEPGGNTIPTVLQHLEKEVIDRQECIEMHEGIDLDPFEVVVSERNICAGSDGVGSCNGDSGGPLVYENEVVGIVSWGVPPCGSFPSIYVRVSYFLDFIEAYV